MEDNKLFAEKLHKFADQIEKGEFLKCVVTTNTMISDYELDIRVQVVSNIGILDFTFREDNQTASDSDDIKKN